MSKTAYTDYPMIHLGDTSGEIASIRNVKVLAYDGDKYCLIEVPDGIIIEVKCGYLYNEPVRLDDIIVGRGTQFDCRSVPEDEELWDKVIYLAI